MGGGDVETTFDGEKGIERSEAKDDHITRPFYSDSHCGSLTGSGSVAFLTQAYALRVPKQRVGMNHGPTSPPSTVPAWSARPRSFEFY